jgi:hypothetical protein
LVLSITRDIRIPASATTAGVMSTSRQTLVLVPGVKLAKGTPVVGRFE